MAEPEYTNGRIRVRPDQIDYLDDLLHKTWVEVAASRARIKEAFDDGRFIDHKGDPMEDNALITYMNRELRLIKTIQDEIRRTKGDMGLE